ncbi:hypothetical protein BEN47_16330 [Hymenobacter lapidarius]|uniref:Lipoprotein n=1 Tax=Hymenobacter lapidarius TaxID=1908237 RepID=A0A1G1T0Q5_9BACT|nr:hypothetical protein [Hymenobacter lapidarius]OGX84460.1 hypothetical protein BEN47_16330 [Hymenobacter lapidarius]
MRHCFFLFALLWLAGCDPKTTSQPESSPLPPPPPPGMPVAAVPARPRGLALADTAAPYTTLPGFGDTVQAPSQVRINGTLYRLETTILTDSARTLRYTESPTAQPGGSMSVGDSAQTGTATGFEVLYRFRLLRPNGQPLFVRELRKSSFAAAMGQELAVIAEANAPVFSGYLPAFNALAFEISLYPPDSDAGGELLVLLHATTGRVLYQGLARWTGGCNSPAVLSNDGRTLLTSTEILQANGHVTKIDNKAKREVAGTLLVNNQTVLVAYMPGYDNTGTRLPLQGPNAELMDLNGRKLAAFKLESVDGGLGYQMLSKYVGQTRSHYLFDETNGRLGVFPAQNPVSARVLALSQQPVFRAPQRPAEVRIDFTTETGTQATFYIDTVSGGIRHRLYRPAY